MKATAKVWLAVLVVAWCVGCGKPATTDGGTPDAGHDAGTPDAGFPSAFSATNLHDGGTFSFPVNSATVTYGIHPDGGFTPATVNILYSSLTRTELCALTLSYASGSLDTTLITHDTALGLAEFFIFPDAGVAFVPGTYVAPDAGVGFGDFSATADAGTSELVSGLNTASMTSPLAFTVKVAESSVASKDAGDGGHLYSGGRFVASVHYQPPDGGPFFNLDVDAQGCDDQGLIPAGF